MTWIILGLVAWLACGVWAAGYTYAFFQRHFPAIADEYRRSDTRFARWEIIGGPLALLAHVGDRFTEHGWLWPGREP